MRQECKTGKLMCEDGMTVASNHVCGAVRNVRSKNEGTHRQLRLEAGLLRRHLPRVLECQGRHLRPVRRQGLAQLLLQAEGARQLLLLRNVRRQTTLLPHKVRQSGW